MHAVEQWLDDPAAASETADDIPESKRQESASRVWERLRTSRKRPLWVQYRHYLSGMAALLVLVSGMMWYSAKRDSAHETTPFTVHTVRTQKGETRRLTLPDSSVVMLGYDSELRYPSAFREAVRRVVLTGEAQFSVKKNAKQPFVVETAAAQTRVLGTVFDVKEYPGEGHTALLVTEGRVRFTNKISTQSKIITVGNAGLIEGRKLSVRTVTGADAEVSWLNNALRFNDMPLAHVARELERRYHVTIGFRQETLKKERYTGAFRNPSLNGVLGSMSIAVGFRYEVKGQSISLYE